MKKKKIIFTFTMVSSLSLLAACNNASNGKTYVKDRGSEVTTDYGITMPLGLEDDSDIASYTVKHLLEGSDGTFNTISVETLSGTIGELTDAKVSEFDGYYALPFTQKTISDDGNTLIEIKYRANVYTVNLTSDIKNAGSIAGSGEYYSYDNSVTLKAKTNIGYKFLGWYSNNKLLSNQKNYSFNVDSNLDVEAKFELEDAFKIFDFTSSNQSCTINGFLGDSVKEVVIPNGVTKIEDSAFYNANIVTLDLPESLQYIGENAFASSNLIQVTIRSDVEFGYTAFYECYKLQEVVNIASINEENNSYGYGYLFYNARSVIKDIKDSIYLYDGDFVFYKRYGDLYLHSYMGDSIDVTLPSNVSFDNEKYSSYRVGQYAFYEDKNINTLTIPYDVFYIDYNAFYDCENLKEIYNLSELSLTIGYTDYGYVAYYAKVIHDSPDDEKSIKSNDLYDYMIVEQDGEFYAKILSYKGDDKDVSITSIDGLDVIIGEEVFYYSDIESLILDRYVKCICNKAFYNCKNLKNVIANDVTLIQDEAFFECSNLCSVEMNSVKSISSYAFVGCNSLSKIEMNSIEYIGNYAFKNCYALYQITLPEFLEEIGNDAFEGCIKLREVINESGLNIEAGDSDYGCVASNAISVVNSIDDSILKRDSQGLVTYVNNDKNVLVAYEGNLSAPDLSKIDKYDYYSLGFNDYLNTVVIRPDAIVECGYIFYKSNNINELIIPEIKCDSLSDLFISLYESSYGLNYSNLKTLAFTNFSNNYLNRDDIEFLTGLETITIPNSVTFFEEDLFKSLTNLKNVYYFGNLSNWLSVSFLNYYSNPMSQAENFYYVDDNGTLSLLDYDMRFTKLTDLVIPDGTKSILEYAFAGFDFKTITFNQELENIYDYAFMGCNKLSKVEIPENVTNIAFNVFENCSALISATLPSSITSLPENLFSNCYSLQSVKFNGEIQYIENRAFYNCYSLTDIELSSSLERIGKEVFYNCKSLYKLDLSETKIDLIDQYTFYGCSNLADFSIPNTLLGIEKHAFTKCDNLAFNEYDGLNYLGLGDNEYKWLISVKDNTRTTINVKEGCERIVESAFSDCKNLKSLTIPNSVTQLGQILTGISTIEYLELPMLGEGTYQMLVYLFGSNDYTYSKYSYYMPQSLKEVVLNGYINYISSYAFYGCEYIESITLPSSVTEIESNAFYNCKSLKNIKLDNVLTIGDSAFYGCKSLDSIDLSNTSSVGNEAFYGCSSIKNITFKNGSMSFGYQAFSNCSSLTEVNMLNTTIESASYELFSFCENLETVYLPFDATTIYESMFANCTNLAELHFDYGSIKTISSNAFKNTGIESFMFGPYLESIGDNAFYGSQIKSVDLSFVNLEITLGSGIFYRCENLEEVILGDFSSISNLMFEYCLKLEQITIPSSITSIGKYAFAYSGIKSVSINNSVESIGEDAFAYSEIESAYIDSSFTSSYSSYLFYDCEKLKTVEFGSNATKVGQSMFSSCKKLSKVILSDSITTIDSNAFSSCTSLASFVLTKNVNQINSYAFNGCQNLLELYNLSSLSLTKGGSSYGYVAYYAQIIHTSLDEESMFEVYNDFILVNTDSSISIFCYTGDSKDLVLPESVSFGNTTYTSYNIYKNAFKNSDIESIYIPNAVLSIGAMAFQNCINLKEVTGLENVVSIGDSSFSGTTSLVSIEFKSLETMDSSAFFQCTNLESFSAPKLKEIGAMAFQYDISLKNIEISKVESIGHYAFQSCKSLKSIVIPSCLNSMGNSIFTYCTSLEEVVFESGCEIVGQYMFSGCSSLNEVTLPETILEIQTSAFSSSSLKSITIPSSLKTIGSYAFSSSSLETIDFVGESNLTEIGSNCFASSNLSQISLPSSLTKIGDYAFSGTKLQSIVIPYSVVTFGNKIFDSSTLQTAVIESATTGNYMFTNNISLVSVEFSFTNEEIAKDTFAGCLSLSDIILSPNLKTIGEEAFKQTGITNFNFTSSIENLGEAIFYQCESLEDVTYDNGFNIPAVPNYMFYKCISLKDLCLADSMKSIGSYAYFGTNLEKVVIPNRIETISSYAFSEMEKLVEIDLSNVARTVFLGNYLFAGDILLENVNIGVLEEIEMGMFKNCSSLTEFDFTNIKYIGSYAFNATSLEEAYISNNVNSIGSYAFYNIKTLKKLTINCSQSALASNSNIFSYNDNLEEVILGDDITDVLGYMFCNCWKLNKINLSNVTYVGAYAFFNCQNLVDITMPSVKTIGRYAFYNTGVIKIELPETLTTLETYSFSKCKNLKSATIPSTITNIYSYVFNGCISLEEVIFKAKITTIQTYAFTDCNSLTKIYYYNVSTSPSVSYGNNPFNNAVKYYYSEQKPETAGNYWYYDESGNVVIWE